tara:strand:- start:1000 stop:1839 length:840 start_codon:yes stop_codon:yes gene_type:complete
MTLINFQQLQKSLDKIKEEQNQEIYKQYKDFFDDGDLLKISTRIGVKKENFEVFKKKIILSAHSYFGNTKLKETAYLPPQKRENAILKLKESIRSVIKNLEEISTTEIHQNTGNAFFEMLVDCHDEIHEDNSLKLFIEATFSGLEHHLPSKNIEFPEFDTGEEFAVLISKRMASINLIKYLGILESLCNVLIQELPKATINRDEPLNYWIFNIKTFWEKHSNIEFTVGHYYEGIGYNSEALQILYDLMQLIDKNVTMSSIATAMRKNRKFELEFERSNF